MKKKLFLLPCIAAVAIATFVGAKSYKTNAYESNDLLMQNVEALASSPDDYVLVKERQTPQCTINVGAKGKIKLVGGTILTADASGVISIDGQVVCVGRGNIYCKPVECLELYQVVF